MTRNPKTAINNSSLMKKSKNVDFSAILVVYKSKEGYWKAFAHPYDVLAQAETKEKALKRLKGLVEVYHAEIKKYDFPSHLVNVPLTDLEDREMFDKVVRDAIDQKGIIEKENYYAELYKIRP